MSLKANRHNVVERRRAQRVLRVSRHSTRALNLAKNAFLATMSHELRTPMNAILGMADMLWDSPLSVEQRQYVEVFRRAGASLLLLIDDILDVSNIEGGNLQLERVEFDLEEAVDQAIELASVKARAKGLMLMSNLSLDLPTVLIGDPIRLRQVLVNLLANAVKFTDSGEIVLTVRKPEPGAAGQIDFAVSDTGIGIPSDQLETIFDHLTQADASTTRKYGGAGLGLGISRRVVEAMGGSLEAASCMGKGSTFCFTAQFEPAPEQARKVRSVPADHRGKRVLLIDSSAINLLILRETLQSWGLESEAFGLPVEALAHLASTMAGKQPYSLVVIDHCMPATDGFETAAEIRRIAGSLPIVMLTCDELPGNAAQLAGAELSGYAVKPISRARLFHIVCDVLEMAGRPHAAGAIDRKKQDNVKPARILVAEDSPDNRLLIQVFLKGMPYQVIFEEDGKAAVDRFAISDFDLVLMDIQMPVMDGLDATRAIRALEQERGAPVIPIIALSANASFHDIQRSGNAGCTVHLSKPISKLDLVNAIEKYLRPMKLATAQPRPREPIRIQMPAGLEDIVPGYLASRRKELPEMVSLLATMDFARLGSLGHNLKGSGGGYGFPELTLLGEALEQFAGQKDCGALRTLMTELGNYLDQVQLTRISHQLMPRVRPPWGKNASEHEESSGPAGNIQ